MKKLITALLIAALVLCPLCGCTRALKITQASSTLDGVTLTLDRLKSELLKNGSTVFMPEITVLNKGTEAVTKVQYSLTICDKSGRELYTAACYYNAQTAPIEPNASSVYMIKDAGGFQSKLDGKPYSVSVELTDVQTVSELPAVRLPETGEYLYKSMNNDELAAMETQPPVAIDIVIDQGGYQRTAHLTAPEDIAACLDVFLPIKIGAETQEWVTDNYNGVTFTFADGSSCFVSLNLKNLEFNVGGEYHMFELDDFGGFWSYAQSVVTDMEESFGGS